ncbi:MAG: ATP-binding protein, partial [Symbiobacteriaceae bacterium]|nr:ATP-binding protein [Symbiobacteriaceae bacterium]
GITPYFPLWQEERKKLVYEFVDTGFAAIITIVDTSRMPKYFLGEVLSNKVADAIEQSGADICGENGEYHTLVFDGPIFNKRIDFTIKEKFERDKYYILDIE